MIDGAAGRVEVLHRFPGSVRPVIEARAMGRRRAQAVLAGEDDRFWLATLATSSADASARVHVTPFALPFDGDGIELADLAAGRLLVRCRRDGVERHEVHELAAGRVVHSARAAECAALTPDGGHVLLFRDEGIELVDLRRRLATARATGLLPMAGAMQPAPGRAPIALDNPGTAMTAAARVDAAAFSLAIGDYGNVVVAEVEIAPDEPGGLRLLAQPRILSDGLVYDPVDVVDLVPTRSVLVRHGHGIGLARFSLVDGARRDCPLPAPLAEPRYGVFGRVVAAEAPWRTWIGTDVGAFLWGEDGQLSAVPDDVREVVWLGNHGRIGLSADGRALLHRRRAAEC